MSSKPQHLPNLFIQIDNLRHAFRRWRSTKLNILVDDFLQSKSGKLQSYLENEDKMLYEAFTRSPDMQMLLNLLAAKEGIWSSILILCLFDKCYKNEFKASFTKIKSKSIHDKNHLFYHRFKIHR